MHCVVTAGPTFEPMDAVRRLTNFSTGRLGTMLAGVLAARGHRVTLLRGEASSQAMPCAGVALQTFSTTEDLGVKLAALAGESVDAVFHAAAVSDFKFGKIWQRMASGELIEVRAGKIPTREGALLAELMPTPKLLARLRTWFPGALLVGWKYEVDGDRASALAAAAHQVAECRTDACVVNGPAYGEGFGLVRPNVGPVHLPEAGALLEVLAGLLEVRGSAGGVT
ncbi:MAG: phosphopantothenoylcysteine decarboxylase [Verrucomicrobiales bacterium]|nr:phosphopantothenoylcysteine decarboxylase [Verrucomicrobiales bacterium]